MSDFIPVLSAGPHDNPKNGACIMEMVSFMSGDEWTDTPKCTDLFLAYVAQKVNDGMSSEHRHLILSQFDRLFNTSFDNPDAERTWLNQVEKKFGYIASNISRSSISSFAHALAEEHFYAKWFECTLLRSDLETDEALVSILKEALDTYDEYVGRTEVQKQDINKLKEIQNV